MQFRKDVKYLKDLFQTAGYDLYMVGGCVRDILLKKEPKDIDLATNAAPEKMEQILKGHRLDLTGKTFAVLRVKLTGGEYEIATYRKDVTVGRKPEVQTEGVTIEEDAERRDLTINAMYMDPSNEQVYDFTGGLEHLNSNPIIIDTPGDARDRFNEDALRVIRAFRFKHRFEGEFSDNIQEVISEGVKLEGPDLDGNIIPVAQERNVEELIKAISQVASVKDFLEDLKKWGILSQIFTKGIYTSPELLTDSRDLVIILANLLKFENNRGGFRREGLFNYLKNTVKFTSKISKQVHVLSNIDNLNLDNFYEYKKSVNSCGLTSDKIKEFYPNSIIHKAFRNFSFSVTGKNLISVGGYKPGPALGNAIASMETEKFAEALQAETA